MPSNLITLQEGAEMTNLFRLQKENIISPKYVRQGILPTCETFDKSAFNAYMSDDNCVGIRIYSGMDEKLKVCFIIVGVDANDQDMYIQPDPMQPLDLFVIEKGVRCPMDCPPTSQLNS